MTSPLVQAVADRFQTDFEACPRVFFAPGRVNLVGAHLDYNGGSVLPLAVDCGVYVAARLRSDDQIRLCSLDRELRVDLRATDVASRRDPAHDWASYPLGVWWTFGEAMGKRTGVDMVFAGDMPMAAGMSSSAAIEVATALALDSLHGTGAGMQELAMIAHRAENDYVGLRCGVMDQFASALGKHGHALLLDCHELAYTHVPIDPGAFEILVMDTKVTRPLGKTRFNERVAECSEAHRILQAVRSLPCLAAYEPVDLEAAGGCLNGALRRRATHVIEEMRRVADAVAGLRSGDIAAVGRALNESHRSARDNYEVSSPELDVITDAARELDVVYGARLTGAGFGGCAIALIQPGTQNQVAEHVGRRFHEQIGQRAGFRSLRVGSGATEVRLAAS